MPSPQSRTAHKRQTNSRTSPKRLLAAVAALAVATLLLTSVIGLIEKYVAIRTRVRDLKDEQQTLTTKQQELTKENDYISTTEGEERELREKYNVVKQGEGMIVIANPPDATDAQASTSRVGRWWDALLRGLGIRKD